MAYTKAKMKKINVNTAPPYFKPFLAGNLLEKYLPTWALPQISFKHFFKAHHPIMLLTK
jgi:hypothetical protein